MEALYFDRPECSKVVVSERDSRYARWDFVASDVCFSNGPGFGIARRADNGEWSDVYQAADASQACPIIGLPTEAGVELRACARPSKHVYLRYYTGVRPRIKPRSVPYGAHANLTRLRWRSWDRGTARASGVFDYVDRTTRIRAPIRLRVYAITICGTRRFYGRMTMKFARRADHRRHRLFEGTTNLGCPDA